MAVAVECSSGHKRAVSDALIGGMATCPIDGCGLPLHVPPAPYQPSYQTDPLVRYDNGFQAVAADLFARIQGRVGNLAEITGTGGSYSILPASGAKERVAKIVIYEEGIGVPTRIFPAIPNGVFIWIRANADPAEHIWTEDMVDLVFPQFFDLMSPTHTLGVAPTRDERFTYFQVRTLRNHALQEAYLQQIVLLLEACCRVC